MIDNIIELLYLILLILIILKIVSKSNCDSFNNYKKYFKNNFPYEYFTNNTTSEQPEENNNNNTIINKKIDKNVRFDEKNNEYYENNNSECINKYQFNYENSNSKGPFMNNLSSWYNNTWIDHFDDAGNPVYKSSNTDINDSEILIDIDIDDTKEIIKSKMYNNKSVKDVYDSLIFNY